MKSDEQIKGENYLKDKYKVKFGHGAYRFAKQESFDMFSKVAFDNTDYSSRTQITTENSIDIHFSPVEYILFIEMVGDYVNKTWQYEDWINYQRNQKQTEQNLRNKYPALDKAYENYRRLLYLVSGEKNHND